MSASVSEVCLTSRQLFEHTVSACFPNYTKFVETPSCSFGKCYTWIYFFVCVKTFAYRYTARKWNPFTRGAFRASCELTGSLSQNTPVWLSSYSSICPPVSQGDKPYITTQYPDKSQVIFSWASWVPRSDSRVPGQVSFPYLRNFSLTCSVWSEIINKN